jgi:predicted acyltransferase
MSSPRFYALDALRGLAIALMILVNTPGSWQHVYTSLLHAPWDGFTFADIVFPTFLFVVGAAMFYSLKTTELSTDSFWRVSSRALKLIGIGVLLNYVPFNVELAELRLPGVLQRIGLAYWLAALVVLSVKRSYLPVIAVSLVLLYWLALVLGGGEQPYSLQHNLVRHWDLAIFGAAHLYQGFGIAFDPEGLLSTVPCVVAVWIGFGTAAVLQGKQQQQALRLLLGCGVGLVVLALVWHWWWPINKALWSGSYLALSSGLILVLLSLLVWSIDIKGWTRLAEPLKVYGTNPLFIYILSWLWAVLIGQLIFIPTDTGSVSLYQWGFELLAVVLPFKLASFVFALLHVIGFWYLSLLLYKRNIIIKL